jgi:hypothetical protein
MSERSERINQPTDQQAMSLLAEDPPEGWPAPPPRLAPLIELDRLVLAIRLRRRLCLIGALVGIVLGLAVPRVLGGPTATAAVLVSRGDKIGPLDAYEAKAALLKAAGANVEAGVMPSTGQALCSSGAVAGPAAAILGTTPAALATTYKCSDAAPDVIRLTVRRHSLEQARKAATVLADSFLAAYRSQQQQDATTQGNDLLAQRARLELNLTDVTRSLSAATYPAQIQSLEGLQQDLLTRIDDLTARASDLQTIAATAAVGSRVVDPPLATPQGHALIFALAGGVLGLGAGAAWAALGVVMRDRPLRRREVATALGEPIALDITRARVGYRRRYDVIAAAAQLERLVRRGIPVLVLESGCPEAAATLTAAVPGTADAQAPVVVAPLNPPGPWLATGPADRADSAGSVGRVAVLLVRAGHETADVLRTGAEHLRETGIRIVAVFLVEPDRYDRTDGFATEAFGRLFELERGAAT